MAIIGGGELAECHDDLINGEIIVRIQFVILYEKKEWKAS
jgi:hypothetical protein